jgi:hypothetical protein
MSKIGDGLDAALAFLKCDHDWSAWEKKMRRGTSPMTGAIVIPSWSRTCRKCKTRITVHQEPK